MKRSLLGLRNVQDIKDSILSQGTAARSMSLALKHVSYSGDLTGQLLEHSAFMEKLYDKTSALMDLENAEDKRFHKLLLVFNEKKKWFEQAEAGLEYPKSIHFQHRD